MDPDPIKGWANGQLSAVIERKRRLVVAPRAQLDGNGHAMPTDSANGIYVLLVKSLGERTPEDASQKRRGIEELSQTVYKSLQSYPPSGWIAFLLEAYRILYLQRTLLDMIYGPEPMEDWKNFWEDSIARLDSVLITTGGGEDGELIQEIIRRIQGVFLKSSRLPTVSRTIGPSAIPPVPLASNPVREISAPSLSAFRRESHIPFVIRDFASTWPAVARWPSIDYLLDIAGEGRIIPVEIGPDYRRSDWTQTTMAWDDFLDRAWLENERIYLAQHSLFTQFPALLDDFDIPDYVYAAPSPPSDYPSYTPPKNDAELVTNAWIGPEGTTSPAHIDPYFNCYVQVVGRKLVWLAPPSSNPSMYPHTEALRNTSQVDVFSPFSEITTTFPDFTKNVMPQAFWVELKPGDMLFFPPGWWHAMRSIEPSFSISMWF